MILTLTPNPALDVTYRLPVLTPGSSHRVEDVVRRAGGKGVNTAGVLARMGIDHLCLAAVDESLREWWDADLATRGVQTDTVAVPPPWRTRTSVAVVADDGVTMLNEAGEDAPDAVWTALAERVLPTVSTSTVLTISGSLPGAAQDDPPPALVSLVPQVAERGGHVVVDGSGGWLLAALGARPALVKPNASEARATTGRDDPADAARALVRSGARAALVSAGEEGVVLALEDGAVWRAAPGSVLEGNPTGAGDAATAAAAAYLAEREIAEDPEAFLRQVVSWSAAAVLHPLAGDLDPAVLPGLAADVRLTRP